MTWPRWWDQWIHTCPPPPSETTWSVYYPRGKLGELEGGGKSDEGGGGVTRAETGNTNA